MTSAAYQTTPTLLPGTVTTDFDGGVESVAVAPQILEGSGDPTGVVLGSIGSFFTDTDTGDVYSNPDGTIGGWVAIGGGSISPLTTKGDIYGFSDADARLPVGTNDQVLTADSAASLGVKWATPAAGASPLTTKGDIYGFSDADARLPVGSNDQVLIADSDQTLGVKWGAAPPPDLSAYSTTSQADALYTPLVTAIERGYGPQTDNGSTNIAAGPKIAYLALDTPTDPFTTFTVNFNAGAADGSHIKFVMPGGATSITVAGGGDDPADVLGGLATAIAGVVYDFVYDVALGANGTWYLVG